MKLLLIGHYPPPHGGISVHVFEVKRQLERAGVRCRVLNLNRAAPPSSEYLQFRGMVGLAAVLLAHALCGWTFHVHTNGHNAKSWFIALVSGAIGGLGPGSLITLHSGMAPEYLRGCRGVPRLLARLACSRFQRIVAVNEQIRDALTELRVDPEKMRVLPAYVPCTPETPAASREELASGGPLISTVLFFRPEYGFELLLNAVSVLRSRYRGLRCIVMGSGEGQREAEKEVAARGLRDAVRLLGDQPHDVCLSLISASDVFVRPTLADGDSISVREALALGVPTVASAVGMRPPGTILFRPGDVRELVAKIELALKRGGAGATREHSIPAANVVELYAELRPSAAPSRAA